MNAEICRPPGLVVTVIVTGVVAAWEIFRSGLGLIALFIANVDAVDTFVILFLFILGVSTAVTAHGSWYFERWAPRLAIIVYSISILILAAGIAVGEGTTLMLFLLVFLFGYFFTFLKKEFGHFMPEDRRLAWMINRGTPNPPCNPAIAFSPDQATFHDKERKNENRHVEGYGICVGERAECPRSGVSPSMALIALPHE